MGGRAMSSDSMGIEDVNEVFKFVQESFLNPLGLYKEDIDYFKVGSWSRPECFPKDKRFGDLDVLIRKSKQHNINQSWDFYKFMINKIANNYNLLYQANNGTKVISVGVPFGARRLAQVDLIVSENFELSKFNFENTEPHIVKGVFRNLLLNNLVKYSSSERNLRWSPNKGLKKITGDGRNDFVIITDINEIEKILQKNLKDNNIKLLRGDLNNFSKMWNVVVKHFKKDIIEEIKDDLLSIAKKWDLENKNNEFQSQLERIFETHVKV